MNLYLIRHTKVNIEPGICYGQADVGVAPSFPDEKENIRGTLEGISFDEVFSSPLYRCKILAESLMQGKKIVFDDRLKELNFGDWELKKWDEIYNSANGKIWMDDYQTLPTLNGESYPEMMDRISGFYSGLILKEYKNVAIFTHAGVVRILKSLIEKQPIEVVFRDFKPEYGSVTSFKI